jgi:hypothetical protein
LLLAANQRTAPSKTSLKEEKAASTVTGIQQTFNNQQNLD